MEMMTALCISSALFAAITFVLSLVAYAKVVGMEKSTHQIQYVPVEQPTMGGPTLDEGIGMNPQNASQMMEKLYGKPEEL